MKYNPNLTQKIAYYVKEKNYVYLKSTDGKFWNWAMMTFYQGIDKCNSRIKNYFYWLIMKKDIEEYIKSCEIC